MSRTQASQDGSATHGGVAFIYDDRGPLTDTIHAPDGCTAIAVAPGGQVAHALATHTADCVDCDFRIARVPARTHTQDAKRPIYLYRPQYPHLLTEERSPTWTLENLHADGLPQQELWSYTEPIGYVDEVEHTHAVLEAIYGMANDAGVAIGESTCAGRFYALPAGEADGGAALFDVSELTRVGLERSSAARECVEVMGRLAEEHGFYGSDWGAGGQEAFMEAAESLVVADATEVWIFHILPDDTGTSALWVAQRVPPGHVAVLANQFIIRAVPRPGEAGAEDFLYSSNLWDVAAANGLWDPLGDAPLDFAAAFQPAWSYSDRLATRRVWRVYSIVAPQATAELPLYTTDWADDYPFSIAAERSLTIADMLAFNRDHFEGSAFDMTKGLEAGPYGDPTRAGMGASLDGSVTDAMAMAGTFERPISLHRTSIATAIELRPTATPETSAAVWLSQYHPAMACFAPMYAAAPEVPRAYTIGSLFRYDPDSSFWGFATVGNYATRWYRYAQPEVAATAAALEARFFGEQPAVEAAAAEAFLGGDAAAGGALLAEFSRRSGDAVTEEWKALLPRLFAHYHDGYRLKDATSERADFDRLFYPRPWLEAVGYWGKHNERLVGVPGSGEESMQQPQHMRVTRGQIGVALSTVALASVTLGFIMSRQLARRNEYKTIPR